MNRALLGGVSLSAMLLTSAAWAQAAPQSSAVEEVVITGTRTVRTRRDTPVRTDVVGQAVLQQAAPRNLADALEYLPGARAESNCQNCNTTEIQLLGLPGAYNQILFDGLPMMSGVAAVYGVEQIPAVLIDRIEVVKGGASALYGPGAVAGVINVIARRPERGGVRATLGYDSPDGASAWSGSVMGAHVLAADRGALSGYLQYEDSPPVDLNGDGYSEMALRELFVGGARGDLLLTPQTRLNFDYQYASEDRRGGDRFDQPPHLAHIAEALDSTIQRGAVSLEHQFTPQTILTGVYSVSVVDRDSFYGGLGDVETDPSAPAFDQGALDEAIAVSSRQYGGTRDVMHFAEARLETTLGAHALIGGVQYRQESIKDENLDVNGDLLHVLHDDSFDNLGAFIQDEWTLQDGLRLLLGARVDKTSELDDLVISPRVGLWWSPSTEWVWRANLSTGFRAPELFSEDIHVDTLGADPVRIRNVEGLSEEKAVSFSLGFDYRPVWNDGALALDAQAYVTQLQDAFSLSEIREDADGAFYQERSNSGDSLVAGAEVNVSYRVSADLQLLAGAAYLNARYDEPQTVYDDGLTVIETRDYLKSPQWNLIGQATWAVTPDWNAYLALRHVGRMKALNNNTGTLNKTPTFFVADLSLTRYFHFEDGRDIDLTFGVKNVFDERQKDLEVGANRDSDYVYGPRAPRTLFVRIDAAL